MIKCPCNDCILIAVCRLKQPVEMVIRCELVFDYLTLYGDKSGFREVALTAIGKAIKRKEWWKQTSKKLGDETRILNP